MTGSMDKKIRIVLADDHAIMREAVRVYLNTCPQFDVVGEAANGHEALDCARKLEPDILVMDVTMPKLNGIEALGILRIERPQLKVLMLTMHRDPGKVRAIVEAGAQGYVNKECPMEKLVEAIETVIDGHPFYDAEISEVFMQQYIEERERPKRPVIQELSPREREVLTHIANGLTNKETAAQLHLSVRTIETHRENIMRKLDIHTASGLTKFAIAKGLIELPEASS